MISKNQVKLIKSLEQKKYRKLHGLFVAEGVKIVNELLEAGFKTQAVYATNGWEPPMKFTDYTSISDRELAQSSFLKMPNQVVAVVSMPKHSFSGFNQTINLILDGIRDPGNLGTIIRLADWYGLDEIFCTEDCVDAYNPKVVQATMGSLFRVKVHYLESETFTALSDLNMAVLGAFADCQNIKELQVAKPCALVIGNESNGVRPEMVQLLTTKVSIARYGQAESLNAAMACGILLDNLVTQ